MSEQKTAVEHNTGKKVWKCLTRHGGDILTIVFSQVMIRLIVIGTAAALPYLTEGKIPLLFSCVLALALYVFVWIPMRCQGGEKLRRMFFTRNLHSGDKIPYQKWLRTGLKRYARGLLWGLPLIGLIAFLCVRVPDWVDQILYGEDAVKYIQRIQKWAGLIGKEPATPTGLAVGAVIVLAAGCLFALLFAYGWWRHMPVEYLPSRSVGPEKTFRWSRHIRRHHRRELIQNTLINMLLCVPGVIGAGFVLSRYGRLVGSYLGGFVQDLKEAGMYESIALIRQDMDSIIKNWPLPTRNQLLALAAVLAALWLPLCVIRKMRNASLIADMMKKEHHSQHGQKNQPAAQKPAAPTPAVSKPADGAPKDGGEAHEA